MNIDNWLFYYKTHEKELYPTTTQMCYEPRVSLDGTTFCMNFCYPSNYQINQERLSYSQDLVNLMFDREVKYLEIFKDSFWAPEVLDIQDKKIFIKWYGKTCNDLIYKENNLPNTWKEDIERIILDQFNNGYYKASLYPHSHYYDNDGIMRSIDFYTCVSINDPFLSYKDIEGVIGTDTTRFTDATNEGKVDISKIFKSGLLEYSNWPENLTDIYYRIFN